MSTYKTIVMSGYYGFDNSGDDAILKAITKDIFKKKDVNIVVLSNNPKKTEEIYKVRAVDRFSISQVINSIKSSSLLISGGGSLLQDITSTRSLWYYLAIIKLAKIYRKPVIIYANGIGPINKKVNRKLTKRILDQVDIITLRDNDSKKFVKSLGVKNKNIYVTADPVFTLDAVGESRIVEIFENENIPKNKKYIGISIRKWKNDKSLILELSKTINEIVEELDVEIIMIPMHYPEDLDISLKLARKVNNPRCYVLEDEYNVEEIMGLISKLELIVAMRLHSLIYAATQEIPMIGLSYDPKVDGILSSLNIDHICPADNFKSEELVENIYDVWKHREILVENLKIQDAELKSKALENVDMALGLLEED